MKKCSKCGTEGEPLLLFYKDKGRPDGFRTRCKRCEIEKASTWNKKNAERHAEHQKTYANNNPHLTRKARREYVKRYPERVLAAEKRYLESHPDAKLRGVLRRRLNRALSRQGTSKVGSAVLNLGCSIAKLRIYLQLQFHRNPRGRHEYMTWDNYGDWEIDHIRPLASFDLADPKQLAQACNYRNLQPMWKEDNRKKGDRV